MRALWPTLFIVLALAIGPAAAVETRTSHGLSLFGDLKYPADFPHFDYVNANAPKGGAIRLSQLGGFDNLNPFIEKGREAPALALTYDTLLANALDEPGSEYGLLAKSVEVAKDSSFVIFALRPEARWHDGKPVTAEDVIFSFETLKTQGQPFYRFYYANVAKAEVLADGRVRFTFDKPGNRELPLIMGQIAILPKHYWKGRDFKATTLEPPLTSGPYKIAKVETDRSITYERVADYWAKDLPVMRGQYNFDRITYITFRDPTVALEGFFGDAYDFRVENSAKNWATAYTPKPAVKGKRILRETLAFKTPEPMQAFVLNLRRDKFKDPRVRLALNYAFDFEWSNKQLFYDQYVRTESYFANSELAATALPDKLELAYLEPYRGQVPPEVFTTVYKAPVTDGSGNDRENLRKARALLAQAGWTVVDGKLTNAKTKEVMTIEFLDQDTMLDKLFLSYGERLKKLGIDTAVRIVDDAQYIKRLREFDFDVVVGGFAQSLSPGNEQREYWSSKAAASPESRNIAGIANPVVDALIDKVIFAPDRAHLVAATRALDRVLLWNHYMVPQWHIPYERVARWDRFGRPATLPAYSLGFPIIWWYDAAKAAKVGAP